MIKPPVVTALKQPAVKKAVKAAAKKPAKKGAAATAAMKETVAKEVKKMQAVVEVVKRGRGRPRKTTVPLADMINAPDTPLQAQFPLLTVTNNNQNGV